MNYLPDTNPGAQTDDDEDVAEAQVAIDEVEATTEELMDLMDLLDEWDIEDENEALIALNTEDE